VVDCTELTVVCAFLYHCSLLMTV